MDTLKKNVTVPQLGGVTFKPLSAVLSDRTQSSTPPKDPRELEIKYSYADEITSLEGLSGNLTTMALEKQQAFATRALTMHGDMHLDMFVNGSRVHDPEFIKIYMRLSHVITSMVRYTFMAIRDLESNVRSLHSEAGKPAKQPK